MGLGVERHENVRRSPPELERGLRCDRFDVRDAAHAVSPKNLFRFCH
jgi:hypothetical protein